jgi:hypothetical protein
MPENSSDPPRLTPARLADYLAASVNGPYADADTVSATGLAAEAVRYLNCAASHGGVTDPATVAAVASSLAIAVYRLPQLLSALGDWLVAEAAAGRLGDDHRRPPALLAERISATAAAAGDQAKGLAVALSSVNNLAATLHAVTSPVPGERT